MFIIDTVGSLCYNIICIKAKEVRLVATVIKRFEQLSATELYDILRARAEVFVVEQSCVYQDLDGIDRDAFHVYSENGGSLDAYLRIFMKDPSSRTAQIGRVLTLKRGCGLGLSILLEGIRAAKEILHADKVYIEAQVYATGFYEKAGFRTVSEEFLEDGIPHVAMTLRLS